MGRVKFLLGMVGILAMTLVLAIAINIFLLTNRINILNEITLNGDSVVVNEYVYEQLEDIYPSELEVPICLSGKIVDDDLIINGFEMAEIVESTESNVTYVQCSRYIDGTLTVGTIHNHPNGNCKLSDNDISTYVSDMQRGQDVIGLYCGEYVFYVLAELGIEVQ